MRSRAAGFSLIELMIVVLVIGIISAVAYPSYQTYVVKGKRAEGRAALLRAAQNQERFFTTNNSYTTDLNAAGTNAFSGDNLASSAYTLQVTPGGAGIATSFIAKAVPVFADTECATLTYNQAGQRGMEGATAIDVSRCW